MKWKNEIKTTTRRLKAKLQNQAKINIERKT